MFVALTGCYCIYALRLRAFVVLSELLYTHQKKHTEVAKKNRHNFVWNVSAGTLSTPLNATLTLLEAPKYSWKAYTSSLEIASHRRFIVATSVYHNASFRISILG